MTKSEEFKIYGRRDGFEVKRIYCFYRGTKFNSQCPQWVVHNLLELQLQGTVIFFQPLETTALRYTRTQR